MNVLYLCLALGPPAIYLFLLGLINLTWRPLLVSGARDTALLGLAVSGLVIVGPMRLFFPEEAAMQGAPAPTELNRLGANAAAGRKPAVEKNL